MTFITLGIHKNLLIYQQFKLLSTQDWNEFERLKWYKAIKDKLLPPTNKNETILLSATQTQFRTVALKAIEKLDLTVKLFLTNLIKFNKLPQKSSVLVKSLNLFFLSIFTLVVLAGIGNLLPATFLTKAAADNYRVEFDSENSIIFPIVKAKINTNETHICSGSSNTLFQSFNHGTFLIGVRAYSDLAIFCLYHFLPYLLQALSAEGLALNSLGYFFTLCSSIKYCMPTLNRKDINSLNSSRKKKFEKILQVLLPSNTKSYLIAFTSGTLGASIFGIAYLRNLASVLPKVTKLFSLISCMVSGRITKVSQVLAIVASYSVYFTILPVLLATIPIMIGGLHCIFASIASNKRIAAYKQQVDVLAAAEKGDVLEKTYLSKLTHFKSEEFALYVEQLKQKLNLEELTTVIDVYKQMPPTEKECINHVGLDKQILLAEKVCNNFYLLKKP